jgi:hypothetical protein
MFRAPRLRKDEHTYHASALQKEPAGVRAKRMGEETRRLHTEQKKDYSGSSLSEEGGDQGDG